MYERFYNLRERPFALSPDPEYLYLSRVHREALDYIRYGVESRAGFIVVTGEIGSGKTTLLQTLLQRLDERTVVARLVNTTLDPRELLEAIMLDFGIDTTGKSKPLLLRDLGQFLVSQRAAGRRPLVVVDEAQNLTLQALEEIRLLSNLETEKSKLLQILLAGQPNLRDKMSSPELEQLRQRVAVSYHLTPLDAADTAAYINYRLQHAAIGRPPVFPEEAAALVFELSRGVPRTINVICDAVLVFGFAEERRTIDRPLVEEAVQELQMTGVLPRPGGSDDLDLALAPSLAVRETAAGAATPITPSPATVALPLATPAYVASSDVAHPRVEQPQPPPHVPAPQIPASQGASPQPAAARVPSQHAAASQAPSPQVAAREAELRRREQALAERERQIAEQRRIMAEEYRLLRRDKTAAGTPVAAGTAGRSPAMARMTPRPTASRVGGGASAHHRKPLTFWQRLLRLFAGEPAL
jgi:putative secretion ATPase (PEP-CTERM system associated)